ncbi:hypothetical protein E4T49_01497 [Aureobasidium sp. EXF-10728]|nr:hypothetical protein E4T49_01497 [Aureobasidium sp. EXF-10728]
MAPQCQALYVSDERRCTEEATNVNGLFCSFHARQVYSLYKGYKRRGAQLDALQKDPPSYLAGCPLHKITFDDIDDEEALKALHAFLFKQNALLDRCIRARRLHHSRFYALELDYGHQHYLDHLISEKHNTGRALERLERRTAEVLYKQQQWFGWVRNLEDDEEKERDAEKKKIKQEAALFKRHWKDVSARMQKLRQKENEQRQAEYLDKVWEERAKFEADLNAEEGGEEWDPIEDVVEDERGSYIDLIRRFLWLAEPVAVPSDEPPSPRHATAGASSSKQENETPEAADKQSPAMDPTTSQALVETNKSKNAKKKARQKAKALEDKAALPLAIRTALQNVPGKPGEVHIETPEEVRTRLRDGQTMNGVLSTFDPEDPAKTRVLTDKTFPLADDEIDTLMKQIPDIKQLLFCRLLLGYASLLPAALRAENVEEFLADPSITNAEFRDLCLKMEQPGLQQLRDACADLGREDDEPEDDDNTPAASTTAPAGRTKFTSRPMYPVKNVKTKREKELKEKREQTMVDNMDSTTFVDFGDVDDQQQYHIKKIRVKVCGRFIYNYPSEKAMSRGGWLQFSVIAKDCSLFQAVSLARSWDEFFELNILTCNHYFPAAQWASWIRSIMHEQLLQVGFIPYYQMDQAHHMTSHHQTGSRAHGQRRTHHAVETRNFVCAHMKRNDPVTRRWIQYAVMESYKMAIMVRDGRTGNVIVEPPDEHKWLIRTKSGVGRASRAEWQIVKEIDEEFWDTIDRSRKWHLGFKDYYDIVVWDIESGEHYSSLYNSIQELLIRALRFRDPKDFYKPAEHVLRTLARDEHLSRARDLRPDEVGQGKSIWDWIHSDSTSMRYFSRGTDGSHKEEAPPQLLYKQEDMLEDQVLFPWDRSLWTNEEIPEASSKIIAVAKKAADLTPANSGHELMLADADAESNGGDEGVLASQTGKMHNFEHHGLDLNRWINDLDTDEELSDTEYQEVSEGEDEGSDWESDEEYAEGVIEELSEAAGVTIRGRWVDDHNDKEPRWQDMVMALELWEDPSLSDLRENKAVGHRMPRLPPGRMSSAEEMEDMREQWELFIDRTRASSFKEAWHKADLEPGAQEKYAETQKIMKAYVDFFAKGTKGPWAPNMLERQFVLMLLLEVDPEVHRRVKRDMTFANAMMTCFFQPDNPFFASEEGRPFDKSTLFDQEARATMIPDVRSSHSNRTRGADQWKDWDNVRHEVMKSGQGSFLWASEKYPQDWKYITRPTIAHLYRHGLLAPRYKPEYSGCAVVLQEPTRPNKPELYFDFREDAQEMKPRQPMQDPLKVKPLLETARDYAAKNPDALFSFMRIWSAPHFWPLMLGYDNRDGTSFADDIGRTWEWKFVPKDMPFSEWSIHHALRLRLNEYEKTIEGKVFLKGDKILVVGKNSEMCRNYSTIAYFALTTRPWRLEVDVWKSFFGVKLEFLEGLDERWWE